jgi:hypothetical protein
VNQKKKERRYFVLTHFFKYFFTQLPLICQKEQLLSKERQNNLSKTEQFKFKRKITLLIFFIGEILLNGKIS